MKYEIFNVDLVGHLAREWGSLSRENIETFSFLRRTAIDMELRSDVSLTFLGALIHMIGMFMIHLCGGETWNIGYIRFGERSSSSSPSRSSGDWSPGCKEKGLCLMNFDLNKS